MFKIFVILAAQDLMTDAGRATTCRQNLKLHHHKQKLYKTKDLSETWFERQKRLKISNKINNTSS